MRTRTVQRPCGQREVGVLLGQKAKCGGSTRELGAGGRGWQVAQVMARSAGERRPWGLSRRGGEPSRQEILSDLRRASTFKFRL